jgi:uncharacterized protein YuzE
MNAQNIIRAEASNSPIVEVDSQSHCAYIRFSRKPVARTEDCSHGETIATIDLAEDGSVIGVELVRVEEFRINALAESAGLDLPESAMRNARYVRADGEADLPDA